MDLEKGPRSKGRIVHSGIDVKSWLEKVPSCEAVRPSHCPVCDTASREPGRALAVVGHGLRVRTIEGVLTPNGEPTLTEVLTRRYECKSCNAIVVVVPSGVGRGYRYSLNAIAWALALWAYTHQSETSVRSRTSTSKTVGVASATRWASLRRWTRCALELFGTMPDEVGTLRERASRIATFIASRAPISHGPVPLDAFYGAAFCQPS